MSIYKSKKIGGEWFDLNGEEIEKFQINCKKIHDNLTLISQQNTYFLDKGDF